MFSLMLSFKHVYKLLQYFRAIISELQTFIKTSIDFSTFTLKDSPKMLWSYHPISEPSCLPPSHHALSLICYWILTLSIWFHHLHDFPISSFVLDPYTFNVFTYRASHKINSKLSWLRYWILTLSMFSLMSLYHKISSKLSSVC